MKVEDDALSMAAVNKSLNTELSSLHRKFTSKILFDDTKVLITTEFILINIPFGYLSCIRRI